MAATLLAGAASSSIGFRGDFEIGPADGGYQQWSGLQYENERPLEETFAVVSEPTRQGRYAARFTVKQGYSPFGNNESTEAAWLSNENEGDEFWYAWSTLFPPDWVEPNGFGIFGQWHSIVPVGPLISFNARDEHILVGFNTGLSDPEAKTAEFDEHYELLPGVPKGAWNDFVVRVKWSADTAGSFEAWHRVEGDASFERRLSLTGIPTLQRTPDGVVHQPYFKQGLYRQSYCGKPTELGCTSELGVQPDTTVYHDGFVRGTSFDDVVAAAFGPRIPLLRPTSVRSVDVVADPECAGCRVTLVAPGELDAEIAGGEDGSDTAYGAHAVADDAGLAGWLYVRDEISLEPGTSVSGNLVFLELLDTDGALILELFVARDRTVRLWSPAGGLRSLDVNLSSGVVVPDDGTPVRVELGLLHGERLAVRIDDAEAIALAPLNGQATSDPRWLLAGVHHYDSTSASERVVVRHRALAYAQTGWLGSEPVPEAPTSTTPPELSGNASEGETLATTAGGWSGAPASHAFRWQRCDSAGEGCADIPDASTASYTLGAADAGATVRSAVTATNAAGSATSHSAPSPVVTAFNFAPDGDFELDPAPWYRKRGTATFTWATDAARSPTHALKIRSTGSLTSVASWLTKPKAIAVVRGKVYRISVWYRTSAVRSRASFVGSFFDGTAYFSRFVSSESVSGTSDWTELSAVVTAPARAKWLQLELKLQGPGTLWIDDLAVTAG